MNDANTSLQKDEKIKFYFLNVDGYTAKVEFIKTLDKVYFTHTVVLEELKGKGVVSNLLKKVLMDVESSELKVVLLCPFIKVYFQKHPELKKLLA